MDEVMTQRYAKVWKFVQIAAAVLAIVGSAIVFCPVWWGNDWSERSVVIWVGSVFGIALIVWLAVLARCLMRAGHDIHAALVTGLLLPLVSHASSLFRHHGTETAPVTFHDLLDRYLWGYPGLAILIALLVRPPSSPSVAGLHGAISPCSALSPRRPDRQRRRASIGCRTAFVERCCHQRWTR